MPRVFDEIAGFALALDRRYQPDTHMWVKAVVLTTGLVTTGPVTTGPVTTGPGNTVLIGMDPLGVETSGTLAQLSLSVAGDELAAGRPFGQLEAVKFVGPLTSPVSGTVRAVNAAAAADPGLVERDPFGDGWLIEVRLADPAELDALLADPEEIRRWYAARIAEYRATGAIAR